ncbi:MAG: hypothetical protein K6E94_03865 [Elusimicrobiaceae bacterium]|nr:hypothetical protein [Elusimicrobiaceae bacterium]
MANYVPDGIEKVNRSQFLTYLDTTPSSLTPTWNILGVGITDYSISYNPQVDTEKWIIEDNARTDHTSNQKQSSVEQKIYKNDPCFEFASNGRDKLNYKTHILDIDRWNGNGSTYPAKMSDGVLVVTETMGETATLSYDLYYDGDVTEGTVTFTGNVPTFTPNVSL